MTNSSKIKFILMIFCCSLGWSIEGNKLEEGNQSTLVYRSISPANISPKEISYIKSKLERLNLIKGQLFINMNNDGTITIKITKSTPNILDGIKIALATNNTLEIRLFSPRSPIRPLGFASFKDGLRHFKGKLPPGTELLPQLTAFNFSENIESQSIKAWHLVTTFNYFNPDNIVHSGYFKEPKSEYYTIGHSINQAGVSQFKLLTTLASKNALLIATTINNKIISITACNSPIESDHIAINGHFSDQDAKAISLALRVGSFPYKLQLISSHSTD